MCLTFENFYIIFFPILFPRASTLSYPRQNQQQKCWGKKKNLFSLYFWISAQVCEGFGKDLQTFERIRVEIWGNSPPPLKKASCVGQKLGKNWLFQLRFPLRFWIWTRSCTSRFKFCSDWREIYTGANTSRAAPVRVRAQGEQQLAQGQAHVHQTESRPRRGFGEVPPSGLFQPLAVLQPIKLITPFKTSRSCL